MDNTTDNWFMPTKAECENSQGEFSPLASEDYIVKLAKVTLQPEPTWDNNTKSFNQAIKTLQYKLICLVYKFKADDGLTDSEWREVKPLTNWIWRWINPKSLWFMKDGTPSFLRALIAYVTWQQPTDDNLKMPAVVVINWQGGIASEEETKKYKDEFMLVRQGKLTSENATMTRAGFKHIPDIRGFEWKYVWARVELDTKWRNKIAWFSKLPNSFVPDVTIEWEAIKKFKEGYQKMIDKRNGINTQAPIVSGWDEISVSDIPF